MPAINLAYLEFRLSGGAANTDPDASLGGIMSSQRILSKSATALSNITGITIDDAPGVAEGTTITLQYYSSSKTIRAVVGASANPYVSLTEDARIALPADAGYIFMTVDYSALSASNQTDTITVSALQNQLFDDIAKTEAYDGDVEYRCAYLVNTHSTDDFLGAKIYISTQPNGSDDLAVALDLAGIGDGSSTGVADTISDENTAPDPNLTFTAPSTFESAITIGTLAPGEACAFWQQRTVPALTLTSTPDDRSALAISVAY